MAGALDSFIQIVKENNLHPEDIQKVRAKVWPVLQLRFSRENKLRSAEDFHYNPAYAMACAIYGIHPAHWLDPEVKQDQRITQFMQRVEFDFYVDENEFGLARLKDPESEPWSTEIMAKGQNFRRESLYRKGKWRPEEFRMTDEEIVEKFKENALTVLPPDKTSRIAETVFELDKLESAAELMEMLSP